ncbi:MAG: adenylate/guanylate cyclase domain-containing protein [Alphaproteobacteria bacterium]
MFCDMRDFTSLSEGRTPEQVTALINRFLTPMSAAILERGGTIDKYIGDAIMAFWNAPLTDEAHARNACEAALAMRDALAALNYEIAREPGVGAILRFGIGLHSGPCLVGNMGSTQRFAYSALGDCVNLAARIEGQAKTYGVDILVSGETVAAAGAFATLELDRVRVKGRQQPAALHALIGPSAVAASPAFTALAGRHAAMQAAFLGRRWDEARAQLGDQAAYAEFGLGRAHALYAGRIAAAIAAPPPEGWDGTFDALTK